MNFTIYSIKARYIMHYIYEKTEVTCLVNERPRGGQPVHSSLEAQQQTLDSRSLS